MPNGKAGDRAPGFSGDGDGEDGDGVVASLNRVIPPSIIMAAPAPSYPAYSPVPTTLPVEKGVPPHPAADATSGYLSALYALTHPIAHPLVNTYTRFEAWKDSFGLYQPGTAENLTKEIKQTHLTNFLFDGARADLTKGLSLNPAFQVTHSFSLASATAPPMYNFGAIYADNKVRASWDFFACSADPFRFIRRHSCREVSTTPDPSPRGPTRHGAPSTRPRFRPR